MILTPHHTLGVLVIRFANYSYLHVCFFPPKKKWRKSAVGKKTALVKKRDKKTLQDRDIA